MPDAVPMVLLRFRQSLDGEFFKKSLQDETVQIVEPGPRDLALANLVHGGPVARPPAIRETRPIDVNALGLSPLLALFNDGTAPIDDGSEGVEDQSFYGCHVRSNFLSLADRERCRAPA